MLADPYHASQIMWNLLSNAATHGKAPIEVTVTPNDTAVAIEVRDALPGIDHAVRDRLFQCFGRGPSSHGTGLGLAIARDLARNDGDLTYATDDAGSHVFVLSLPHA